MLSKENIEKINFNGLYSHEPDIKYRGELYSDNLYWCFNWIFIPKEIQYSDVKETYFKMIDTYYGDKGIELTNKNINEFTLIFDFNDVEEISKQASYDYNDEDVFHVAIGSGGWQYSSKYFINKGTKKNKDILIDRITSEIQGLESKLEYKKNQLIQVQNNEIDLKYVF